MFQTSVNGKTFEIVSDDSGLLVDGKLLAWDLIQVSDGYFHIVYKNRSYRAEVVKTDRAAKTVTLKINGRTLEITLKDKFDLLLEKMGMNAAVGSKINHIKAPMPGLIIELKVSSGQTVDAGDPLLILEAMKMENIIKSPGAGTIKNVTVKKGDSVEKGQVLIEF